MRHAELLLLLCSLLRTGSLTGLRVPPTEALQQLRNVLQAYAEHNPQVAYCQSMNFLVAVLLLVVDEETAFWCLAAIVERCMPGHFSTSMAMALVDQSVLCELLRHEDPELVAHLEELQVPPSLVTTQWMLTCFVGSSLPVAVLLRVWDAFFEHRHSAAAGDRALFSPLPPTPHARWHLPTPQPTAAYPSPLFQPAPAPLSSCAYQHVHVLYMLLCVVAVPRVCVCVRLCGSLTPLPGRRGAPSLGPRSNPRHA